METRTTKHEDDGIVVLLSPEGLRRAYGDNALLRRVKNRERLHAWMLAIALGLLLGYTAAQTAGVVS